MICVSCHAWLCSVSKLRSFWGVQVQVDMTKSQLVDYKGGDAMRVLSRVQRDEYVHMGRYPEAEFYDSKSCSWPYFTWQTYDHSTFGCCLNAMTKICFTERLIASMPSFVGNISTKIYDAIRVRRDCIRILTPRTVYSSTATNVSSVCGRYV